MSNWIKDNIARALHLYAERGREEGFSDEELQEVCRQTWIDISNASRQRLRDGIHRSISLSALLKKNHAKMVQKHGAVLH